MPRTTLNPRSFAYWIAGELRDRQMTQAEFARRAGLSSALVSNWVNGTRQPSIQSAQSIAEALDVDVKLVLTKMGLAMTGDGTPARVRISSMLEALRLTPEREATLMALLEMWNEQDRTAAP